MWGMKREPRTVRVRVNGQIQDFPEEVSVKEITLRAEPNSTANLAVYVANPGEPAEFVSSEGVCLLKPDADVRTLLAAERG